MKVSVSAARRAANEEVASGLCVMQKLKCLHHTQPTDSPLAIPLKFSQTQPTCNASEIQRPLLKLKASRWRLLSSGCPCLFLFLRGPVPSSFFHSPLERPSGAGSSLNFCCWQMFATAQMTTQLWTWKLEYLHHEQRPLYFGEWF